MKEKGIDGATFEEDVLVDTDQYDESPARNLEGKNRPKWYEFLPYEKFVKYIPKLRYIRGSKAKIQFTSFEEVNRSCQQIFECNKSFFRFRSQVDLLAHYLGLKILEHIYLTMQGRKKSALEKLLEESEPQFEIWDQMKAIKDIFRNLCEKRVDGFLTDDELDKQVEKYLGTFETPLEREKMAKVIDKMIERGEYRKATDRNNKHYERHQKAKEKGISVVAD